MRTLFFFLVSLTLGGCGANDPHEDGVVECSVKLVVDTAKHAPESFKELNQRINEFVTGNLSDSHLAGLTVVEYPDRKDNSLTMRFSQSCDEASSNASWIAAQLNLAIKQIESQRLR